MNGFLGSAILETAIGTVFLYLLLAIFCTAAVEWIAALLQTRANTLREAISHLLKDQLLPKNQSAPDCITLLRGFYQHPVISGLMKDSEHPEYLSPRAFSTVILDLVQAAHGVFNDLPDGPVHRALVAIEGKGQGDLGQFQAGVESWFDDAMQRASCNYQKRTKIWTLSLAIAITVATNADTFEILRHPGHLPGWSVASLQPGPWIWIPRTVGWLLTVGAVSLGAPFWFDVLNRFVNLRNSAKPSQASN